MYCLCCQKELKEGEEHYHASCFRKLFSEKRVYDGIASVQDLVESQIERNRTVPGVQEKLSLNLERKTSYRKTLHQKGMDYIVKFPSSSYPDMPEMENLVMNMADLCKIDTVLHGLYPIQGGYLYVTKRADRNGMRRLAMEDFCQLSYRLTQDKYKGSYESFQKIVSSYSSYPKKDLTELLYRILFCFLTGNNDMHLKNFSLMEISQGYGLSPAYDLINASLLNPKDEEETALTINGKKKNLHYKDFLSLSKSYQIEENVFVRLIERLCSYQEGWLSLLDSSLISSDLKKRFKTMLKERISILSRDGES